MVASIIRLQPRGFSASTAFNDLENLRQNQAQTQATQNALVRDDAALAAQQGIAQGDPNALAQLSAFDPGSANQIIQGRAAQGEQRQTDLLNTGRALVGAVRRMPPERQEAAYAVAVQQAKQLGMNVPPELEEFPGPEGLAMLETALGVGAAGGTVLSPQEQEVLGLDPSKVFQRDASGKISAIGDRAPSETETRRADLVAQEDFRRQTEAVSEAVDIIDESFVPATGVFALLAALPFMSPRRLSNAVDQIKASLGFEELQKMREASPTGGALGQVTERELAFLQSTVATLDPLAGEDPLRNQLSKVVKSLANMRSIIEGGVAFRFGEPRRPDDRLRAALGEVPVGEIVSDPNNPAVRALWDGQNLVPIVGELGNDQ